MRPHYKHSDLGSSFQQTHTDRPGWPGPRIDEIPGIGALRLINGLESIVRRSVDWFSRWRQRRTAIRELQALNDHYLKDIGLDRSHIVTSVEEIHETRGQTAARAAHRQQWK